MCQDRKLIDMSPREKRLAANASLSSASSVPTPTTVATISPWLIRLQCGPIWCHRRKQKYKFCGDKNCFYFCTYVNIVLAHVQKSIESPLDNKSFTTTLLQDESQQQQIRPPITSQNTNKIPILHVTSNPSNIRFCNTILNIHHV